MIETYYSGGKIDLIA